MDLVGAKYNGDIVSGRMEGKGQYTFANGNIYDGDIKDGKFNKLHFNLNGNY